MSVLNAKILINNRLLAVLLLGFSSGLPLALTGTTLQAWFTHSHLDLMTIGALSLVGIPYTLKFLWAPIMDQYALPWLGRRRGWIVLMQSSLVIMLLIFANMDPIRNASMMGFFALLIAFLSASQDIAIDAYRTDVLTPEERGLGVSYYVFTYRIAVLLSGGLALILADYYSFKVTYEVMALFMLLSMIFTLKSPVPFEVGPPSKNIFETIAASFLDLLEREKVILILLFIVFYKIGDALALSLFTKFLLDGLGFSLTSIGLAYKIVSFFATVLGCFVGGVCLTRLTLYRALLIFGLAQAFSNLMFVALAVAGKQFFLMSLSIFVENFCSGLSTAALLAFMMSLCNHRFSASQFALLSAIASLGRVLIGPVAAMIVQNFGWIQFYILSFVICFPGLLLLIFLKDRVLYHVQAAAD